MNLLNTYIAYRAVHIDMNTCTNTCTELQRVLFVIIITDINQMSTTCAHAFTDQCTHTPGNNRISSMVGSPTSQQTTSDKTSATNRIPTYTCHTYMSYIDTHTFIHVCICIYVSAYEYYYNMQMHINVYTHHVRLASNIVTLAITQPAVYTQKYNGTDM